MYATVEAPVIVVKPAVAEMVKYVANTWHAAKVTLLTNGRIAKAFRVDGGECRTSLCRTPNQMSLLPTCAQFAYGGSCALGLKCLYLLRTKMDVRSPLSMVPVTNSQVDLAAQEVRLGARNIGLRSGIQKRG